MTAVRQHRDECRLWASLRWALCCVCFLSVFVRAWISGRAKVSMRAYVSVCVCIFVSCFRLHVGGVCLHVCLCARICVHVSMPSRLGFWFVCRVRVERRADALCHVLRMVRIHAVRG